MLTVTRRIEFDAAHRLRNHESKCRFVHGHRYVCEASVTAEKLDAVGRVIDFGIIKEKLGGWVDTHWDHTLILEEPDHALGEMVDGHTGQTTFYLPYPPTAENMARYLLEIVCPALFADAGVRCTQIRLYETPNCHADIVAE